MASGVKSNFLASNLATIQIHSNTTISPAMLAPALLARLLQHPNVMSSAPPSWVWATLKNFILEYSRGGVAFRGADVARLLQHLLGEGEAESGESLQSLRSKLSPFLDSTLQTMAIAALPVVLQHLCLLTLTRHQCEELLARGGGCSGSSLLLEVRGASNVREVAAGWCSQGQRSAPT